MAEPNERFIGEQKNKSKLRLISRFDDNERKFVIVKCHRVEYEKIADNALSVNFRFERQQGY